MGKYSCAFCSIADELMLCTWPVRKFVRIPAEQLVVDDIVRGSAAENDRTAKIVRIARHAPSRSLLVWWQLVRGGRRQHQFQAFFDSLIWTLRDDQCGALCCERHRAERGPDAIVCADHLRSWEAVA